MARLFDDASNDYLKVDQAAVAGVPFAVSIWVRRDADVECISFSLVDKDSVQNSFVIQLLTSGASNQVRAFARDAGGYGIATTTGGTTDNVWQHILALFVTSTDRRVLLNGGSKGTNATSRTPANMDRTAIGYWGTQSPSNYFSGDIGEVAIWDLSVWPGATAGDKADNFEKIIASLAGGSSPEFYSLGLVSHWELVRGLNDIVGGLNLTAGGTAVSVHSIPGLIYPAKPQIVGTSAGVVPLAGTIAIQSGMSGALKVARELSGAVAIQSGMSGALKVARELSGTIEIQTGVSGILTVQKENVRWSEGLFTFRGISYEIAAGESNKIFIYWDPNYTTMFRATNNIQDVLNCDGWIMCLGESGVASPVFARKLIHGGIIQAGTITAEFGQIAVAAITTANIKDLAVETIKVKDNAITLMVAAFTAAEVQRNDTNWYEVQTITLTTTGAPVMLMAAVQWKNVGDNGCNIRVQRDDSVTVYSTNMFSIAQLGNPFCVAFVDEPDAGEHIYDLDMQTTPKGVGDPRLWYRNRSLVGKEVKK